MARTYRELWPRVTSWENLCAAYRSARRRKRYRPDVAAFEARRTRNLRRIQETLRDGSWSPGAYRRFEITRPKRRVISAAPFCDRIVHHAWVRAIEPIFERRFIHHSYACRVGKGTHRALDVVQRHLRRFEFVLQTDVERFFPSIDHAVVLGVLDRTIRCPSTMTLIERILETGAEPPGEGGNTTWFPGDDLLAALRPRGLPIGNLTSQFLGNVLLDRLDHFVTEELGLGAYVRYCDDVVVFSDDRRTLVEARDAIQRYLTDLRLRAHPRKTFVRRTDEGMGFLGFRTHARYRRLLHEGVVRSGRRLRRMARSARSERRIEAWAAHIAHGDCEALRRHLLTKYDLDGVLD